MSEDAHESEIKPAVSMSPEMRDVIRSDIKSLMRCLLDARDELWRSEDVLAKDTLKHQLARLENILNYDEWP